MNNNASYVSAVHETTKHIQYPGDFFKIHVTVHAKPEVATAAKSMIYNLFIHDGLAFRKSPSVLFMHVHLKIPLPVKLAPLKLHMYAIKAL